MVTVYPERALGNRTLNENRAFLIAHSFLLCVVLVGFARTFYLREWLSHVTLDVPLRIHGLILTSWFTLTVVQAGLMGAGQRAWHRRLAGREQNPCPRRR